MFTLFSDPEEDMIARKQKCIDKCSFTINNSAYMYPASFLFKWFLLTSMVAGICTCTSKC